LRHALTVFVAVSITDTVLGLKQQRLLVTWTLVPSLDAWGL
jgi:hypothetical protein